MKFSCCSLDREEMIQLAEQSNSGEAIRLFKLLTHPTRFKILQILAIEDEICTAELAELGKEPQPAITKQLTHLKKEGILTARKLTFKEDKDKGEWEKHEKADGKWTAYRLVEEKRDLIIYLLKPFIQDKFQLKLPDCDITVGCVKK